MKVTIKLSEPQRLALLALVTERGLQRFRSGYGRSGRIPPADIAALEALGLCRTQTTGPHDEIELAVPTESGWRLLKAAVKGTRARIGSYPAQWR